MRDQPNGYIISQEYDQEDKNLKKRQEFSRYFEQEEI